MSTTQGIWAIKWSFIILGVTSILQLIVVYESRSVALFADAIHNVGDAGTAIPLWIAFMLARRAPSERSDAERNGLGQRRCKQGSF